MRKKTIDMIPILSDGIKAVLSSFSKSRSPSCKPGQKILDHPPGITGDV